MATNTITNRSVRTTAGSSSVHGVQLNIFHPRNYTAPRLSRASHTGKLVPTSSGVDVDEDEYKETYLSLNTRVCAFEKVILSRQCDCARATRIFIAERQAVGCDSDAAQQRCSALLHALHNNANFALRLTSAHGRLPHAKEMKVQCGGLLGLQAAVHPERSTLAEVPDIHALVDAACTRFGALDGLPYSEIVKAIAAYQGRRSGGQRGR